MQEAEIIKRNYGIYQEDVKKCNGPFAHISTEVTDPRLDDLDRLYGVTDRICVQNAQKHRLVMKILAITGTLLTFAFLIYGELGIYEFIFLCCIALLCLMITFHIAYKKEYHRKYLEYRVLAETIRVQFFLSIAAIEEPATNLLPWFIKKDVPWIKDAIGSQPVLPKNEKKEIIDFWIRNQMNYHSGAIEREKKKERRNNIITYCVLIITFACYISTAIFEAYMLKNPSASMNSDMLSALLATFQSWGIMDGYTIVEMIRAFLKIAIGTTSVAALFTSSYYGKMYLPESIKDHERMNELYQKTAQDMKDIGEESEKLILDLSRDFLIEIEAWYSYQNQNKPELVF